MSHFSVLVLTPPDLTSEEEVTRLLAPYDESGKWFREGSHWDWWVIGGRWTGHLDPSYDPYADPANYETCQYCEGTGVTTQAVADKYPAYQTNVGKPCFQCAVDHEGKPKPFPGRMLVWHLKPHGSDMGTPVADVLKRKVETTFAVVTPDGEWHQRGEMGWFGSVRDEKHESEWKQAWHSLLTTHKDMEATIVDCHI